MHRERKPIHRAQQAAGLKEECARTQAAQSQLSEQAAHAERACAAAQSTGAAALQRLSVAESRLKDAVAESAMHQACHGHTWWYTQDAPAVPVLRQAWV